MSLLGIFLIALVMSFAFSPYKKSNPLGPLIVLFLILLLSGIAAHYWVIPFGPRLWGVYWLPVLTAMFAFGLLFSSSPRHIRKKEDAPNPETENAMGIFVWLILFILLVAIAFGVYSTSTTPA